MVKKSLNFDERVIRELMVIWTNHNTLNPDNYISFSKLVSQYLRKTLDNFKPSEVIVC